MGTVPPLVLAGVFAMVLVGVTLTVVLAYYTRPRHLGPLVERILGYELGGHVDIGLATLSWDGRLTLNRVRLSAPGLDVPDAEFARVFDADRIMVDINVSSLWRGVVNVQDLEFERPRAYFTEDVDTGILNVSLLQPPADESKEDPGTFELKLPPSIDVNGARVRFLERRGGVITEKGVVRLEGELQEDHGQSRLYAFELRQYDQEARVQATLDGTVNTRHPALDVTLKGLRLDTPQRQLVPRAFRTFWDQLRPTGSLPNLSLSMSADDTGRLKVDRAVLELHDVALSPPYTALELPSPEARAGSETDDALPRMTEVDGRFVLADDVLRVENLTGMIEGIRYHANGYWGLTVGAAGQVEATTDPFTLGDNPPFLASLPKVVAKIFGRLQPSGTFRATTRIERPEAGVPLEVGGVLDVIDGRGMYHKFPYPLEKMTGRIRFDRRSVRVEGVEGQGPHGGSIRIDGVIEPPNDGAAVRITVAARGIPFDDDVLGAMKPERREDLANFFDVEHYQAMLDAGLLRRSDQAAQARGEPVVHPEAPVFDLGGRINVDVLVDRPYGDDVDYTTTTTIEANGINAIFKHWPYPLSGRSGRIIVVSDGGGVTLDDVAFEGPTGGHATLTGRIETPEDVKTEFPHLTVTGGELPIDGILLQTLPDEPRQLVTDLHPAGVLRGDVAVTRGPDDFETQWRVDATIPDGSIQPNGGRYTLDHLRGGFTLGNHGLELHDVTARHGETAFDLDGRFTWRGDPKEGDTAALAIRDASELNIHATALLIESSLLDVLPEGEPAKAKLAALEAETKPRGLADATLQWNRAVDTSDRGADEKQSTYVLDLVPSTFSLDYKGDRIAFQDMTGSLRVRPGRLDVNQLAGHSGAAYGEIDGLVGLDGVEATAISISANDRAQSPLTRTFIPAPVLRVLDAMEVSGRYRLRDARLFRRPDATADASSLEFEGVLDLEDTSLSIGVPVTQLAGTLQLGVREKPGDSHPAMRFALHADHLRAADRRVAPLTVTLDNAADRSQLTFDSMLGSIYGGVAVASGRISLDPGGDFEVHATLSDVAVEPFTKPTTADPTFGQPDDDVFRNGVNAQRHDPPAVPINATDQAGYPDAFAGGERWDPSGLLSAGITLSAPLDDPARRFGRGTLTITDATIYDRPLSNALLRASNLSLPSGAPLDSASARFLIDGDRVHFNQLALTGPGLTIAGTGTMTWPDTELSLLMVSRSSRMPRLGPVSDLIDLFKNELIAIRVRGTLAEPRTNLTTLRNVRDSIDETFDSFEDRVGPAGE